MINYLAFRWAGPPRASAHFHLGQPTTFEAAGNYVDKLGHAAGVDAFEETPRGVTWWYDITAPIQEVAPQQEPQRSTEGTWTSN